MLEKEFQNKVIQFLKQHDIYYIKVWGGGFQRARYTRLNNLFKRKIYSNRIKKRNTENQHHFKYTI